MTRPLVGIALQTYFRRLKLEKDAQDLLIHIRSSPPSRLPDSRAGNMPVWYPSKKMQCIMKAESAKVEFAFLLEAEHDNDVLEFWDQPPPIELSYRDRRGHLQQPCHTADYIVFRYESAGWEECKPVEKLKQFVQQNSKRYVLDEQGQWRCPPGEAFAAKYGLTYRVKASDQINWASQDNWLYLEDYYQDLEKLAISGRSSNLARCPKGDWALVMSRSAQLSLRRKNGNRRHLNSCSQTHAARSSRLDCSGHSSTSGHA